VASYYKLPLSFEANKGQTDARVHFLARGGGYTIFLAGDEAVLTLRKSSPSVSRLGKFGPPGRLEPFGLDDPHPVRWPSIGGYLKSLWRSLIPDLSQMVPDPNAGKRGVAGGPEAQPPQVVRMRLLGGNAKGRVVGLDELPGRSNYICGNDPKKWRTSVPSYAQVKFEGVYSGVDLVYYGSQRQLEYDFVVAPGANPDQIKLSFTGADGMRVDAASGDLVLKVGDDEVRFQKPAVYQSAVAPVFGTAGWEPDADLKVRSTLGEPNPEPRIPNPDALSGAFVLASNNEVAFRVAGYDPRRALVIDPVLSYSTYLGGSGGDQGDGIAVDTAGNAYVTGYTMSTDFPTANPLQTNCDNCQAGSSGDAFVAKLNPSGSALVYSTYLGGSDYDVPYGIAVNTAGNAYVTGWTGSTDFPTANPLQASIKGVRNAFVTELNAGGSALLYSTYLGGSDNDVAYGIAVDTAGNAYVTGYTMSTDFPTANPLQGTCGSCNGFYTAFVAKLNPTGSALVYSTYLGGSGGDQGDGIAVDTAGNAYVTGWTASTDFPTANPLQTNCDNCQAGSSGDAFVAKINPTGSALVYSTFLGGSGPYDYGNGIAVDSAGNAYVTGETDSTDFPTADPLQASIKGLTNAFVTELNAGGSALLYSTYLGGSDYDAAYGIAVDTAGNAYVTGYTMSTDFPTANPLQGTCGSCNGFYTAFVAKLNPTGSALVYSTYLGGSGGDQGDGIAVDTAGNAYVTGWTASTDFPTANPLQTKCDNCQAGSSGDAFVAKISPGPAEVTLSTNTLTFASYSAGTTSAEESVTLTSSGAGLLTLTSITASGDFALITTGTSCPYTGGSVASSATCTIDVTFTPTTTGLRTGSVTINDNASNTPQVVSLSGTGTAPGVSLSTTSVSFGNQAVGTTSASRAVTVTNNGTASLTFTGIAATGDFTVAASGTTCSSSAPVAASSNCVINVLFTPTATGSRSGSLTLTDNASGTPQTVSLSGTGTGPVVSLSARLTFSAQLVGTTSSSQAVTLTNTGNASLTFTAIAVTAPFAIATSGTTCSTSSPVAAAATCTVAVTFMPTVAGSASGTLSFSDDAPNTPQTIALTGTGQDFSFAPPSGSSTSATVAPGSPATYTLSVGGEAGLSGTVNFTCTGAPSGAICSVSPNPLTVGSSATNVTVTVTTTAPSVSAPRSRPLPPAPPLSPGLRSLLMVALVLTAMAWAIGRRNQPGVGRWRSTRVPLAVGLLLTLALAGCGGGGGGGSGPSNPGTTPGGYILTVTGSTGSGSSTLSHSVTLTLTVS
jgi:hypothetical protein